MPSFTKTQMLDEFRTIALYEADHILMLRGAEIAATVIGFALDDEGEYLDRPASLVDLQLFPITSAFERGYDFAFRPSFINSLGLHEVQDLLTFMQATPKAGGIKSGAGTHLFMTPDGFCQTVADAAFARWKLEYEPGSGNFTARELALLAEMTEGAVRNAMSDKQEKSENKLHAIPGTKNPVLVEHAEAARWLRGRRGFVPTPDRPRDDRFLAEHLANIRSVTALGDLLRIRLLATFRSLQIAAEKLRWSIATLDGWLIGTQTFDADQAEALARALDLDVALFLGKALEATFRRDHAQGAA